MERNAEKILNEYQSLVERKKGKFGGFYSNDIISLWDLHDVKAPSEKLYYITADALQIGFMIGYKAAKREQR